MIIGISGHIGSGKDTVGKIIQYLISDKYAKDGRYSGLDLMPSDVKSLDKFINVSGFTIKKFAYAVKQVCSILTGIPIEDFEKQEVKDRVLGEEWTRYGYADGFSHVYRNGEKETIMNNKQCDKERYELELKTNWQTAYKHERTVRELLQLVGTNAMRNIIHEDVWVNALMNQYYIFPTYDDSTTDGNKWDYPNWIITDVRFENEAKSIEDRDGFIIRVNRDLPCPVCKFTTFEQRGKPCTEITCPRGRPDYIGKHASETALNNYDFDYTVDNNGTIEELIDQIKTILFVRNII